MSEVHPVDETTARDGAKDPAVAAPPASLAKRVYAFLNMPLGLTLMGFFLTGIIGAAVTASLGYIDREHQRLERDNDLKRQQSLARTQQANDQIGKIRELADNVIWRRVVFTDLMRQAFDRQTSQKEMDEVWSNYWQAYQNYQLFMGANTVALQREFGPGSFPANPNTSAFWMYINYVIKPEFENIHRCIVGAHDSLAGKGQQKTQKFDLNACMADTPDKGGYWKAVSAHWPYYNPWAKFQVCVQTYVLEIDYSLRYREEVAAEEQSSGAGVPHDAARCPANYQGGAWCRQQQFNRDLMTNISVDCGAIPPNVSQ